ncbi:unnamed protein product [Anisakis simplex]|uniref:Ethanolaminephosphotransferase 1 (inferred by orthology to a human protein) n=1 Tax=Anisakis simplex TaxID=6269 RepID=A0A0M3KAR0_ANISI|nr:unnamed protein product [Anisakis simplex]
MAITFFASYALDGMDGKQARRTGTSSPIGEFFDHGIDTWALVPVALTMFSIINICSVPFSLSKVYAAYFVRKSGLQPNAYEAFLPLFPSSIFFAVSIVWAHYSPNDIISVDPRCFFWTMGSVFSNIMCRLIMAQTTRTRAQTFNWLLAVYCIGAAIPLCSNVTVFTELLIIRTLALTTTLAHLHYGICVIRQLCDHFNTAAFSISRPQQSAQKTTHSSTAKTFDSNHSVHAESLIKDMAIFPWD